MTVLDKIKAFFTRPKPEAKATEKKAVEPAETKAAEASEENPGKSTEEIVKSKRGVRDEVEE